MVVFYTEKGLTQQGIGRGRKKGNPKTRPKEKTREMLKEPEMGM